MDNYSSMELIIDKVLKGLIHKESVKIEKLYREDSDYSKEFNNLDILYRCLDELEDLKYKARILDEYADRSI